MAPERPRPERRAHQRGGKTSGIRAFPDRRPLQTEANEVWSGGGGLDGQTVADRAAWTSEDGWEAAGHPCLCCHIPVATHEGAEWEEVVSSAEEGKTWRGFCIMNGVGGPYRQVQSVRRARALAWGRDGSIANSAAAALRREA